MFSLGLILFLVGAGGAIWFWIESRPRVAMAFVSLLLAGITLFVVATREKSVKDEAAMQFRLRWFKENNCQRAYYVNNGTLVFLCNGVPYTWYDMPNGL